uniref:Uncharacterized protein n=1 Tax=Scophthalmus maximus TaxID=52904 RepID=A0A8D3D9L1_SCOMX
CVCVLDSERLIQHASRGDLQAVFQLHATCTVPTFSQFTEQK